MNFVRSLEGLTTDEIVAANRKRNKQIKAAKAKEGKS